MKKGIKMNLQQLKELVINACLMVENNDIGLNEIVVKFSVLDRDSGTVVEADEINSMTLDILKPKVLDIKLS
jgi:hypothetical protein